MRKQPGSQKSFSCKCLASKFIETNWPPYWMASRRGVLGLVVAGRGGDAGWAWREWNKPEGRGGEIERMIHLAGGCRQISGVEGLGGSWETEREMVPVGKKGDELGIELREWGAQWAIIVCQGKDELWGIWPRVVQIMTDEGLDDVGQAREWEPGCRK